MKAALISLGSVSSQMTADAMRRYFDSVDMIQLKEMEVRLGKEGGVYYQGKPLGEYDCIFAKGSFRYSHLLRSITMLLYKKTPYMPLPAPVFTIAHNKMLTHLVLQQHNIPMPRTYVSPSIEEAKLLLNKVNYPIVMKFPEGTQGKGVMFADSKASASSFLDALEALKQPFIIQEYIETGGEDIRALVVGDKVVAAMKRIAKHDEKRSNLHAGGTSESVILGRESQKIAVDTAKALGADICGVDILQGPLGPVVIEVNISPGLQGISQVSTIDVADQIGKLLFEKTDKVVHAQKHAAAKEVMKQISINNSQEEELQQIITTLPFRGERVLLPPFVTKIAKLDDGKEYAIKARKGKVEIEEFDI